MTDDPLLPSPSNVSSSAAERLAALRSPSKKRNKPAHTSKVLTAGVSTTALFGMVAVMGWQSGTGTAQNTSTVPVTQVIAPTIPVVPVTTPPTVAIPQPVAPTPAPAAPTVPETVPPTVAPVITIPVAVPAPAPVVQAAPTSPSNTKTKSSG